MITSFSSWHLKCAQNVVTTGGVIAYPTEAVYGLGCDPWNAVAVARILDLKQRSPAKGLIVIAADVEQLEELISFPDRTTRQRVLGSWPGPHTWLVPAKEKCPQWLTGNHDTLAVRVTAHPLCRALCSMAGPLVSTSANRSDKQPARTAWKVQMMFDNHIDYILHGVTGPESKPSMITDALTGTRLR